MQPLSLTYVNERMATMKLARVLPIIRLVWLMAIAHRLRKVFSLQGLRYAALIVFTVVVGGGVIFVAVEPGQDLSTWDGLWWAAEMPRPAL